MSKRIVVEWEGPYSYLEVRDKFNLDNEIRSDCGLYQIYGPHPLYSNKKRLGDDDVLLYIGQTIKGTFSGRIISTHGFCHSLEYKIYLGRIDPEGKLDNDIWESDVQDAEKILISNYAPPYNAMYVGDLNREQLKCQNCVIINKWKKMDLDEAVRSEDVVYRQA